MNRSITFILNDREVTTPLSPGTATLDFIRGHMGLPGTKEGCREGECGACTVLLGEPGSGTVVYKALASCMLPLGELDGKHLVTIEGLKGEAPTPIQDALVEEGASQCGFCTPGFVMSLTAFFMNSPDLDQEEAVVALDGNICRCTGYMSIKRAVTALCRKYSRLLKPGDRVAQLVDWGMAPPYFKDIPTRLETLSRTCGDESGTGNSGGLVVAGATDLYVQAPGKLMESPLAFISRQKELQVIKKEKGFIHIGAGVTVEELKNSPLASEFLPLAKQDLDLVASTLMRNRATPAGNIVNASPIGDMTIILLALDASLSLSNQGETREVALKDFFLDYKKLDMKPGEVVSWIKFPLPPEGSRFNFEKVSRRRYLDIASVNSALSIRIEAGTIIDARLSAGGVAPIPLYLERVSTYLAGKELTTRHVKEAASIALEDISPISDVRGSAGYKRLLLRQLIYAHFTTLFPAEISTGDVL